MSKHKDIPILCLDFDGVCHSYSSGWQGAATIPDAPVEGLFEFLIKAQQHFRIAIFSSRSHQKGGKAAMVQWFNAHYAHRYGPDAPKIHLEFPDDKPPAKVTIDDRGLLFTGTWPNMEQLIEFQPWYKQDDRLTKWTHDGVDYTMSEM